jgi:ribosomal protein S12 methylthiotransferase
MNMSQTTIYLSSLGCARNLVDSEIMLGRLKTAGFLLSDDPETADVIIVNTCSFIESAIDESIDTILELARFKESGRCRRLIVTGCLPERFREEIVPTLPEVDFFLGTGAFDAIVETAKVSRFTSTCYLPDPNAVPPQKKGTPRHLSAPHSAYLKISDGCDRHCTYCIIPKLRGRQKSRAMAEILAEVQDLHRSGVKELVLVAQDTTAYGKDLRTTGVNLGFLLRHLTEISEDMWIRILYGHPDSIDDDTMFAVANHSNICSYLDIPIQHASDRILKAMGRNYNGKDLYQRFKDLRSMVPDIALRTSVMVGFPGETEDDVSLLLDFMKTIRFDHLGVFMYSDAEDLPSHGLPNPVSPELARDRYDRLMSHQLEISRENLKKYVGRQLKVLVEEPVEENLFIGRTQYQAPEVDGITYIRTKQASIGCFETARIIDALEYDLIGECP